MWQKEAKKKLLTLAKECVIIAFYEDDFMPAKVKEPSQVKDDKLDLKELESAVKDALFVASQLVGDFISLSEAVSTLNKSIKELEYRISSLEARMDEEDKKLEIN